MDRLETTNATLFIHGVDRCTKVVPRTISRQDQDRFPPEWTSPVGRLGMTSVMLNVNQPTRGYPCLGSLTFPEFAAFPPPPAEQGRCCPCPTAYAALGTARSPLSRVFDQLPGITVQRHVESVHRYSIDRFDIRTKSIQ